MCSVGAHARNDQANMQGEPVIDVVSNAPAIREMRACLCAKEALVVVQVAQCAAYTEVC